MGVRQVHHGTGTFLKDEGIRMQQAANKKAPRGRIEIDFERCKACELCVPACPRKCIEMGSRINAAGFAAALFARPEDCTGCAICAEACPDVCIEVWR